MASREFGTPFNRHTVLVITACGIVAFFLTLLIGAYAPDLRSGNNGGTHALSNSAVGYSALVALADRTGRSAEIVRNAAKWESENLLVVSPEDPRTDLTALISTRMAKGTLFILPKWRTQRSSTHSGWVQGEGLIDSELVAAMFAPQYRLLVERRTTTRLKIRPLSFLETSTNRFREPRIIQTISNRDLDPLLVDSLGNIVLGRIKSRQIYVLADPDLLDNYGLANPDQARAALSLLDSLNSTDSDGILFDVTVNGLAHGRSPLRLMFDPPFLGVTLGLLTAFLLAAWQASTRFGEPVHRARAFAFGKRALVDNSAALVRRARREAKFVPLYVATIRRRAASHFRLHQALPDVEVDRQLDRLAKSPFTPLAVAATQATSRAEMLRATQRLNQWVEEIAE